MSYGIGFCFEVQRENGSWKYREGGERIMWPGDYILNHLGYFSDRCSADFLVEVAPYIQGLPEDISFGTKCVLDTEDSDGVYFWGHLYLKDMLGWVGWERPSDITDEGEYPSHFRYPNQEHFLRGFYVELMDNIPEDCSELSKIRIIYMVTR